MIGPYGHNDLWLAMFDSFAGSDEDLAVAQAAFESTVGDFPARWRAALRAIVAAKLQPELFIEIPDVPERLSKAQLDELVRPAAGGFLSSYTTKQRLLEELARVTRRQERRPSWVPRVGADGQPITSDGAAEADDVFPRRPVRITAFGELGTIDAELPASDPERPELPIDPGGVGELELALHTVLRMDPGPFRAVSIDADAVEALVPEEVRWWSDQPVRSLQPIEDPAVASETLATAATLGGVPVADALTTDECLAAADVLDNAGDWRHGARWVLDAWDPGQDVRILVAARASIAGWADDASSGLLVHVDGSALHETEGVLPAPGLLHSYLLWIARSPDSRDPIAAIHRVIFACPGEGWCHRGGCPEADTDVVRHLSANLALAADIGAVAQAGPGWAAATYDGMYGSGLVEYADDVLRQATFLLHRAGWVEIGRSEWEGGLDELLVRRGPHALTVAYDPVTRQVQLRDGKQDLDSLVDVMGDDGIVTDEAPERTDRAAGLAAGWTEDTLTATDDLLTGRLRSIEHLVEPITAALLGLHPHADGELHSPRTQSIVAAQLANMLRSAQVVAGPAAEA
ncbi:hypothetical protein [Cryptosporangium sp. NPDC051539]|uniref:hypothetical protein n=1 Tax=Cryptosporangium sp. NPDC051539 TaxID=3363962 RepID=UPI00379D30AE